MSLPLQEVLVKYAALAALLLAVPAVAQNRADEISYDPQLARSAQNRAVVEQTLVAMRDAVGVGAAVADFLRDNGYSVAVRTQKYAGYPVWFAIENGQKMILLSDSVPATLRVYGALIAKGAAELMYADMPISSEYAYMRRSTVARVWIELGGELSKLPVVEPLTGDMVAAISDEISLWADKDGAEMALYRIGQAEKLPSLMGYTNPAVRDSPEFAAANARFVDFLIDESPARKAAGLR